jgi:predicted amidohydrolase
VTRTVAAVQFEPALGDVPGNLARLEVLAGKAAGRGASLVVFPECSLSGYELERDEAARVAVDSTGPEVRRLRGMADRLDVTLVVGLLERSADALFNAALTLVPDRGPVVYRKTHLPRMGVDRFCARGDGPYRPVATPIGLIGVLICYDLRFPEPARLLALAGARLIAVPTNWPATATDYPEFLLRARASENRLAIVAADRMGEDRGVHYLGRSQIVAADGTVLQEAGLDEAVLIQALGGPADDWAPVAGHPDGPGGLLADRRPDLYALSHRETPSRSSAP